MQNHVAKVKAVSKYYGDFAALKDIKIDIPGGRIFGLLGPNGAGKSTLIKILVGSIHPTYGEVKVLDLNPNKDKWQVRKQIGYMPQTYSLYEDLSARENIKFFAQAYNLEKIDDKVEQILKFTELIDRADDPIHTYSGGMKKRVSLACALIHKPKLLFLDEPTAAVDPHLKRRTWELFRELTNEGTTIFVSTHLMDEVLLCDDLAILRDGELVITGTPQKILENGYTQIDIKKSGGEVVRERVRNTPSGVAKVLNKYGLDSEVEEVNLFPDTIEDVFLSLIKNK